MDAKFLKPYSAKEVEDKIYTYWETGGYFRPETQDENFADTPNKDKTFSIVLPPPNVTGNLHIGHSAMLAIEDIMVRFNRMRGYRTLWLPGTDHAAIATQTKVEKLLSKEKVRRQDLGREKFLERVDKFAQESHNSIVTQCKKMGASPDWTREAFTLDDKRTLAVRTAFKRLYDLGVIEQGTKVVNWCPRCASVLSDDEIEYKEGKTIFYTFRYAPDFPIVISTTRPETKLGDTGVAVNPSDTRYRDYVGKIFTIDLGPGPQEIKIVTDQAVDMEFGTGALGVTPAHSQIDEQIAIKNNLPSLKIIDEHGRMTKEAGPEYEGLKTKEAREKFVIWLRDHGLIEKEEEIEQNLSVCYRCGNPIEPLPSKQWFIAVNKPLTIPGNKYFQNKTIREVALEVVKKGEIKIIPDRFEKNYYHWLENLHDWCISRQIWYGHRIPIWYRTTANGSEEISAEIKDLDDSEWKQEEDTLDTWFSSGLWTFSTLGWPDTEAPDFKRFHPTSVLETGYDILFFWVARMIIMTTVLVGDVPFKTTYLHGLVRDEKGRKMSKSLGNVLDPIDLISKYGADAVRLSLIIGTGPGNDSKVSEDKIRGYKNFSNKLWNMARFIIGSAEEASLSEVKPELIEKDQKLLDELRSLTKEITADIENYRFYLAGEKLYHYAWHRVADELIEQTKIRLKSENKTEIQSASWTLLEIFRQILIMLHPFIPFVTEEIWSGLPYNKDGQPLIVTSWPTID